MLWRNTMLQLIDIGQPLG